MTNKTTHSAETVPPAHAVGVTPITPGYDIYACDVCDYIGTSPPPLPCVATPGGSDV